jgi:hypothetical protein
MKNTDLTKLGAALAVAFTLSACAEKIPTETKPCPCADGDVCCDSGVCAADEAACGAATFALSKSIEGDWVGYFENFLGGDDAVAIQLAVAGDGALSGRLVMGTATPPPPATDPDVQWPDPNPGTYAPSYDPVLGFAYTLRDIRWEEKRLRFGYAMWEPWDPWCRLQQPVSLDGSYYECAPNGQNSDLLSTQNGTCINSNAPSIPYRCFKTFYCDSSRVCTCDANGCVADTEKCTPQRCAADDGTFDLVIRGDIADGTAMLAFDDRNYNIRLTRRR